MKFTKTATALILLTPVLFYSCQKTAVDMATANEQAVETSKSANGNQGVTPYQFERINEQTFSSKGWREQQVNIVSGITIFSDSSDHVDIVCGPDNNSDPRLIRGCATMNLPTGEDPTLRRIRLRKIGYSGTLLADLTELKYSTYVVNNAATIMVLQIDVNGDETKDFNIYLEPRPSYQAPGWPPLVLNTWQQWNALAGIWRPEAVTISGVPGSMTISQLVALFPNARIIDTAPAGHNGEGVRFTIGGTPRSEYDNTVGYFDALIIGTTAHPHSTMFDFTCAPGND